MLKAEADSILQRDTGPIEAYLAALASERALPDLAVGMCLMRLEEAAPALRAVLAKAAHRETLADDEARLLLRGVYILGGGRDTDAFPLFVRLLRRPEADLWDLLGETLEARLPKILSGMFDGDAEALFALARDRACCDDVRISALEAAAFLVFDGRIARDRMQTFLSDFAAARSAPKEDFIWVAWAEAIAHLAYRDLVPLVEAAFTDGRIAKSNIRKRQFDKELAAAEAAPEDADRFAEASYIEDALEALEWTRTGEVSGAFPDSAPAHVAADARIELHLAVLGDQRQLPDSSLMACVARFEAAGPALRALLDRAAGGRPLSEDEGLRMFRGLHVLAAARDTTACASLLRLLRRPAEETEDLLGDAITMSLPRIVISVFDGDVEALFTVIADRTLDDYVRGSVLDAATYLTWERRIDRERLRRLLVEFYEKRLAADEDHVWYAWMQAVAHLDFADLVPLVETAWKAGRIDHSFLDWSDFKLDVARARTAYDDVGRFGLHKAGYVDDVVAELGWTRHWGDEDAAGPTEAWDPPSHDEPVTNPFKHVGRNDPCPCGSGKKFKKCCLTAG